MAASDHCSALKGHLDVNGCVNGFPVEQSNDVQNDRTELYEPIAIIGCAMRLPGRVNNSEALWDLLINKRDGRCRVPSDRYNIEAFHGPGKPGCVASEYG